MARRRLGYAFYLPEEDRYLRTKEELIDRMIVALAGRAAEESRLRSGHERRRERPREGHRDRPLDGLRVGDGGRRLVRTLRRQLRRLSETKPLATPNRPASPTLRTRRRFVCCSKHRAPLDRLAQALLEKETLLRDEVIGMLSDVEAESRAADTVGVPRVVAATSPAEAS